MALSRRGRLVIVALVVIAGGLLALAAILPRLLDIDRYRPMIVAKVQEATGRTVTLGPISLRLFPMPALSVSPLSVSEGSRYPGREALHAEGVSIHLALLPLLRGRVAIRSIVLDRPALTLIRDARGRWSYDDLLARASAARKVSPAPAESSGGLDVVVEKAQVRSGTVRIYDDAVLPGSRAGAVLRPIDATVRGWGAGAPTDLDLAVGLGGSTIRLTARLTTSQEGSRMDLKTGSSKILAADLVPLLPWLGVVRPKGLEVGGRIGLEGSAALPLEHPETIRYRGALHLDGLIYRDASMTRPLSGLGGTLQVEGDRAVWNDFTATVGSSILKGKVQVTDFLRPRISLALSSPRVDLNEIIAALTPSGAPATSGRAEADRAGAPLVGGLLDQISGRGTIDLGSLRFLNFDLSGARAAVTLEQSVLALSGLQAALYGGRLEGAASVDLGHADPRYVLGAGLRGVDIDPLLTAYDPGLKKLLRGTLTGRLDLDAAGAGVDAITRTARGSGNLEIDQGAVTSISILGQLASLLEMAGGKGIGRQETPFEYLRGSVAIAAGKARTDDLTLHAPDLDLAGTGWIGLDASLDLGITARLSEASTRGMVEKTPRLKSLADRDGRLTVRLRVAGTLAKPGVGLDTRSQVREIQDKAKEKVRDRLRDRLKDLLNPDSGVEPEKKN